MSKRTKQLLFYVTAIKHVLLHYSCLYTDGTSNLNAAGAWRPVLATRAPHARHSRATCALPRISASAASIQRSPAAHQRAAQGQAREIPNSATLSCNTVGGAPALVARVKLLHTPSTRAVHARTTRAIISGFIVLIVLIVLSCLCACE